MSKTRHTTAYTVECSNRHQIIEMIPTNEHPRVINPQYGKPDRRKLEKLENNPSGNLWVWFIFSIFWWRRRRRRKRRRRRRKIRRRRRRTRQTEACSLEVLKSGIVGVFDISFACSVSVMTCSTHSSSCMNDLCRHFVLVWKRPLVAALYLRLLQL